MYSLHLPYPPSVNGMYRRGDDGQTKLTQKAKTFRLHCKAEGRRIRASPINPPVVVSIYVFPPDRRKRDIDNIVKAILDGLEAAQVLKDDSNVARLEVCRCEPDRKKQGYVNVSAHQLSPFH